VEGVESMKGRGGECGGVRRWTLLAAHTLLWLFRGKVAAPTQTASAQTFDPARPPLRMFLNCVCMRNEVWAKLLMSALLALARGQKQPRCPPTRDGVNHLHTRQLLWPYFQKQLKRGNPLLCILITVKYQVK
jgi:hypothetical protein